MTLTDTGALVALLDKDDDRHAACVEAASQLPPQPMLTTMPCFTEAIYLLGAVGVWRYQQQLWKLRESGRLVLHELTDAEINRMAEAMEKYQDTPMDLADASLVAVAESRAMKRVFTIDSDFHIFRMADCSAFETIP